eukprot:ctg_129.g109
MSGKGGKWWSWLRNWLGSWRRAPRLQPPPQCRDFTEWHDMTDYERDRRPGGVRERDAHVGADTAISAGAATTTAGAGAATAREASVTPADGGGTAAGGGRGS